MPQDLLKRFGKFVIAVFAVWFMIWQVTPVLVENIPPLKRYGQVADENDIYPGALYYNEVDVTMDSEMNNRDTIKFLPQQKIAQ